MQRSEGTPLKDSDLSLTLGLVSYVEDHVETRILRTVGAHVACVVVDHAKRERPKLEARGHAGELPDCAHIVRSDIDRHQGTRAYGNNVFAAIRGTNFGRCRVDVRIGQDDGGDDHQSDEQDRTDPDERISKPGCSAHSLRNNGYSRIYIFSNDQDGQNMKNIYVTKQQSK